MPRRADLVRRTELARAALDVVRARGAQLPMRELAAALGIKRPTLYFYFADLGAVFDTVIESLHHALGQTVAARMRAHDHPIDRLRAAIDAALAVQRAQPALGAAVVLRWAQGGEPAAVLARERRGAASARDALIAELRAGIARREVRPCEPERVVDVVLAFVAGAVLHDVLGVAFADDAAADELARRVLEPLRARRKSRRGKP